MSFVSSAWDFAKRHKGKVLVLSGAIGGFVYLNRYLSSVEKNWETSASKDFVADVRRKDTHFENSIRTCNSTCSNLVPRILQRLDELLDAGPLLERAQVLEAERLATGSKITKEEKNLWKELMVIMFTRAASEVYCVCFFVCYVRVQLLVIAGYIYANDSSPSPVNHMIQQKYVSLLNAFNTEGIEEIVAPVRKAAEQALLRTSLLQEISSSSLQQLFDQVITQIRKTMTLFLKGPAGNAARILLKPERIAHLSQMDDDEGQVSISASDAQALETLIRETQDLLETEDFNRTLKCCFDTGFSYIMDLLVSCYVDEQSSSQDGKFSNPSTIEIPMAKLLIMMRPLLYNRNSGDSSQSLVRHLLCLDILNCYSANVYEAFCDSNNRSS